MLLQVQSFSDGREYLANGLRSYADGLLDEAAEREFLTLYRVYQRQDVYRLWSGQLTDTAFFSYQEPSLGKAVAAALYGQTISGSVSRLEQFAACAYAHFLRYGMKLKEQEEFAFEAVGHGKSLPRRAGNFCGKTKGDRQTGLILLRKRASGWWTRRWMRML